MKKLSDIVTAVKDYPVKRVAVAAAADPSVIEAVKLVVCILITNLLSGDSPTLKSGL